MDRERDEAGARLDEDGPHVRLAAGVAGRVDEGRAGKGGGEGCEECEET